MLDRTIIPIRTSYIAMARILLVFLTAALGLMLSCAGQKPAPVSESHAAKPAGTSPPLYSAASIIPTGEKRPAPLSPGRIVTIYGRNLGPAQPCTGAPDLGRSETPSPQRPNQTLIEKQIFPHILCETEVFVGPTPSGLLYVSSGQINFKVPQTAPVSGESTIRVAYKTQSGPAVSLPFNIANNTASAEDFATGMLKSLSQISWQQEYGRQPQACASATPKYGLGAGLRNQAFACSEATDIVTAESFYYPTGAADPKILLLRADLRPNYTYPELSAEIAAALAARLTKLYGPSKVASATISELGTFPRFPASVWHTGDLTVFLHQNSYFAAPTGSHHGVAMIAVRKELLDDHERSMATRETFQNSPQGEWSDLVRRLDPVQSGLSRLSSAQPKSEAERSALETQTYQALIRLLSPTSAGPEVKAARLVAANHLTLRLGNLIVIRSYNKGGEKLLESLASVPERAGLARLGVVYTGFGHYSGDLEYDYSLLKRAWKEHPETEWGQRAFLRLQQLTCATDYFRCKAPNCVRPIIEQGENFLVRYPESTVRRQQIYNVALAYSTWWSLGQATPDDIDALLAEGMKAGADAARIKAIALFEELVATAPGSPEAISSQLVLPRLKLKLDTGERTYFCTSC